MHRHPRALALLFLAATASASRAAAQDAPAAGRAASADERRARAQAGDAAAQTALGAAAWARGELALWRDAEDPGVHFREALAWFGRAAGQGHAPAQWGLGVLHYNGEGVLQDRSEAARWFRKAADQGHADAQRTLGGMHAIGDGVARDPAEAYFWLHLAAALCEEGRAAQAASARDAIGAQLPAALLLATRERCREWLDAFRKRTK